MAKTRVFAKLIAWSRPGITNSVELGSNNGAMPSSTSALARFISSSKTKWPCVKHQAVQRWNWICTCAHSPIRTSTQTH